MTPWKSLFRCIITLELLFISTDMVVYRWNTLSGKCVI